MDFVIRYFIFTTITLVILSIATEKWAKYYVWLMIGFMLMAGLIFIV